jgi:NADPH-dependent 2,4-dienoyl-CoA reductase/sulfur reductase-like enzyme
VTTGRSRTRLVVVGGDAAGMSAASQARRLNQDLEIVAFERGSFVSYSACGEPYYVGGLVESLDQLVARTPEQFAERDIEVHIRHEVTAIDLDRREVTVVDLASKSPRTVAFDHLMVATGSRPLRPSSVEGVNLPGVVGLRTLDDAAAVKQLIDDDVKRVLVLGGGYIGIEVAEALVDRGIEVVMITSGGHVLERTLDDEMGILVDDAVRSYGVELHTGMRVRCIRGTDRATGIGCDETDFSADLIVIGLGAGPETGLAKAAGIPLGVSGAIAVDEYQRTSIEGVWSAGDCAEVRHRVTGKPINIALGTVANKTGRIAGTNVAATINGTDLKRFPGAIGTAITKIGSTEISRTGLKLDQARAVGFSTVVGAVTGTTTAGYWPTAERMDLMVIADAQTGKVLGGQIVGGPGAGKKIDVIATAIWNGMTAEELSWVDLAYAPPFSAVWDLVHIAARRAAER